MSDSTAPLSLKADNISFSIGAREIVRDVSLTIQPGQTTALLGSSGAGKSTLLRLIAGLEKPDAGNIWRGDTLLSSPDMMVRAEDRQIGLIFQDFALFPHLTLLGNVMFGLDALAKPIAKQKALAWLERVGLTARANDYPHHLSGGEQQRVAIARALVPDPVAILMDEPFSGLDPALREDLRSTAMSIIKEAGIPALLVTHDAGEAMQLADTLCIMRGGRIIQNGSPDAVYTQPVDKEAAMALGPLMSLEAGWNSDASSYETAFGAISFKSPHSDATATLYMRPEAIYPDQNSDISAEIQSLHRKGPVRIASVFREGQTLDIVIPAHMKVSVGQSLRLSINPALCWCF